MHSPIPNDEIKCRIVCVCFSGLVKVSLIFPLHNSLSFIEDDISTTDTIYFDDDDDGKPLYNILAPFITLLSCVCVLAFVVASINGPAWLGAVVSRLDDVWSISAIVWRQFALNIYHFIHSLVETCRRGTEKKEEKGVTRIYWCFVL